MKALGLFINMENLKECIHGTVGEKIGCLSFNGNKIITCGGGGMLLTNDDKIV